MGYLPFCVIQKTTLSRLFKRNLSQILAASTPLGEQFSGLYSKASEWNNKITRTTVKQNNTSDIITIPLTNTANTLLLPNLSSAYTSLMLCVCYVNYVICLFTNFLKRLFMFFFNSSIVEGIISSFPAFLKYFSLFPFHCFSRFAHSALATSTKFHSSHSKMPQYQKESVHLYC